MNVGWYEPSFGEREKTRVNEVLEKAYPNEGLLTRELEEKLQKILGVKHVILTTSGTAALFLAIKADQIVRELSEYEVIIPDLTCIATASAVRLANGTPVLVDVEKSRHTIDIREIRKKITSKTKMILPVHILGRAAPMKELRTLAHEHNITLIEDAAGALYSHSSEGYLGTLGKVGCFSLQSNKIISCGQGGIVVTNDDTYNEIMRRIKDQGRLSKSEVLYAIEGYNFKFNDVLAAIVLGQLETLEERKHRLIAQRKQYETLLRIPQLSFPPVKYENGEIPLWVDPLCEQADRLVMYLKQHTIQTRKPGWPPVHRNLSYKQSDDAFPVASFVSDNAVWLPNGPTISSEQIEYVCKKIKEFYQEKFPSPQSSSTYPPLVIEETYQGIR